VHLTVGLRCSTHVVKVPTKHVLQGARRKSTVHKSTSGSMAASLLALLSQQTPNLATRKALILTGLQHDFLSPDGKLPVNNLDSGFLKRTKTLINEFRPYGQVIWIRTEIDTSRHPSDVDEDACNVITSLDEHVQPSSEDDSEDDASDSEIPQPSRKRKPGKDTSSPVTTQGASKRNQRKSSLDEASTDTPALIDEEHFLTETADREACFIKGTLGADYAAEVKSNIQPTDLQVTKAYYSAFSSSSLLSTLRMKLITELYVCGAMTNLNVYATSMDAARYGIKITLVEDCLGYRHKERHDLAIKRLVDIMDARVTTSDQVIAEMGAGASASRSRVTGPTQLHPPTLGANIDVAADMLEVASSDDEDDEDLLSVRASPPKSHRPLEIKSSRPQDEHLHVVDTGSEPHPQFQRLATAESNTGAGPSKRTTTDDIERPGQVETVELEITRSLNRLGISDEANRPTATTQTTTNIVNRSPPDQAANAAGDSKESFPTPSAFLKKQKANIRSALSKIQRRNRKAQADTMITRQSDQPLFGMDKEEESQSSSIQYDLLPPDRVDGLFHKLKDEVKWQKMHHQTGEVPRLVCCQGTIDSEGNMPVYRHPSDEPIPLLPWSTTVNEIRQAAEAIAGHELNHALIQLYRAGTDFISEHSDKTLDIRPDSFIVNASFGAERVMRLRTKRSPQNTTASSTTEASSQQHSTSRTTHRVRLPHNSALLMSLETNARYLHSIHADKRPASELTPAEKAYDGQRISLTFRHIGTYLDAKSEYIWGQGATGKERENARKVINGDAVEVEKLVRGFGAENAAAEVALAEWYGCGSDVLHLK
jgi:nicotinamidase-related amidase/alkylated DNA repair dioxygenase AlkB